MEEAQFISDESFSLLNKTIRKPGSEIWISMNPTDRKQMIYRRFCLLPNRENTFSVKVNWYDLKPGAGGVPRFSREMEDERQFDLENEPGLV